MKTGKNNAKFIVVIMVILFITCFAMPAFAASATINVEVVVYKQTGGGSEPYANVQVTLGQNSKNTSRRGNVEFRLENIPTTTMVTLSTADPNIPNGSHSKLNLKLDTVTTEVVHSNGPGIYDIYIAYTKETKGIVIKFMVTQNDEWEILPIEFNQQSSNNPPPAPNEPEPNNPAPNELEPQGPKPDDLEQPQPEMYDPDMPHPEEPNFEGGEQEQSWEDGNNNNLWLYIIIGVLGLAVITFIIIFAVKRKKKSKE